ncbi:MAG: DUF5615 family PIN-like protein [Thermoleophilia bacterium]
MKLALDEHLSPAIAVRLAEHGVDALAVVEVEELAGSSDIVLLARMARLDRALVTADYEDFARLDHLLRRRGERHAGLLFIAPSRFDLRRGRQGLLVDALARFAADHPDGIAGLAYWLEPLA